MSCSSILETKISKTIQDGIPSSFDPEATGKEFFFFVILRSVAHPRRHSDPEALSNGEEPACRQAGPHETVICFSQRDPERNPVPNDTGRSIPFSAILIPQCREKNFSPPVILSGALYHPVQCKAKDPLIYGQLASPKRDPSSSNFLRMTGEWNSSGNMKKPVK